MYKKIILILLLVFIPRIPFIISAGVNFNDPATDIAQYYLLAKSIKEGKGLEVDFGFAFFKWEGFSDKEEITRNYWLPIGYPLFLSIVLSIQESLFAALVSQVILTFFLILLMYFFFRKIFDDNIAMLSVIIISLMPQFFFISRIPFSEILYLLCIIVTLIIIINKDNENKIFIILAGIISTYAFYIRYPGLILITSVFFWLLFNKKYYSSFLYAFTCFISIIPFFYINHYYHNDILAFLKMTYVFPPAADEINSIINISGNPKYHQILSSIFRSISAMNSEKIMFMLFVFGIISLIKFKFKSYYGFVFLFGLFTILFHMFVLNLGSRRYLLPLAVLLIPMALFSLRDFSKYISDSLAIKNKNLILYIVTIFILFTYILLHLDMWKDNKSLLLSDDKNYEWIKTNAKREDNILAFNPFRCNYFTGNKAIIFPENLNEDYFEKFVDIYDIKYVQTRKHEAMLIRNNEFYKNTIFSFKDTIKLKNIILELKDYQNKYGDDKAYEVFTYEIIKPESINK